MELAFTGCGDAPDKRRGIELVIGTQHQRRIKRVQDIVRRLHVHARGQRFGHGDNTLRKPSTWKHLWNPFKPSWGEPYKDVAARMMAAVHDARVAAEGHEAVLVSHQLPIWTTRLHAEKRSYLHDPRKRQCTLCSLTSLHFVGDRLTQVSYSEPAGDLIPTGDKKAPFSAGGAPEEHKP